MKKITLLFVLILTTGIAFSQENSFTIGGGYAFSNIDESSTSATGFRINGLYEYTPTGGKFSHGFSVGYIATSGSVTAALNQTTEYKITNWPVYYAPKYTFGNGSLKGFVKGAIGMQFASIKRTGPAATVEATDSGFYGGLGVGGLKELNEKMFISLEYEWAYSANSYYKDGFMNTINLGIGFKF